MPIPGHQGAEKKIPDMLLITHIEQSTYQSKVCLFKLFILMLWADFVPFSCPGTFFVELLRD